jgi:hypothetical protein
MEDKTEIRVDSGAVIEPISQWAGKTNASLVGAASAIFGAATGAEVSVKFEDHEMIIALPTKYVEVAKGDASNDDLIQKCVASGLRRLEV